MKLSKDAYAGKREWAARRMADNKEIGAENGLSEEQCDALERLAAIRHDIHTHWDSIFHSESGYDGLETLGDVTQELIDAGFDVPMFYDMDDGTILGKWLPDDSYPYYSEDDFNEYKEKALSENPKLKDNEDDLREAAIEGMRSAAFDGYDNLNTEIEIFLRKIDEKYGTEYCPSGATRI